MGHPILYEINTRCWLRELSERAGHPVTLAEVPDSEFERWRDLGFTHIWLMGVWQVGEGARSVALHYWREDWSKEIECNEADVHGSPFAVREYDVDARLGKTIDLLLLKERFARAGLSLILDFVPNHLGLDSSEPLRFPSRFVQAASAVPGTFELKTKFGKRHFAHGRDPYFPPWSDTIQIDYRLPDTVQNMAAVAQTVGMFGHGLRCDMAMLLLPEVFESTWKDFPPRDARGSMANFWRLALPAIRQMQPQVDLIAEVYWDREEELQDLGFDYTYHKPVTDLLARGEFAELAELLSNRSPDFLRRSVHFIENHDEPRAASVFPFDLHKAAALLILSLPGMALLHDGQLEGRTKFARIQLNKRPPEPPDRAIADYYQSLLKAVRSTAIRRGKPEVLKTNGTFIAIRWNASPSQFDLCLVNLYNSPSQGEVPLNVEKAEVRRVFATEDALDFEEQLRSGSFHFEAPARSGAVFRISASA